jgi:hypothetical protein
MKKEKVKKEWKPTPGNLVRPEDDWKRIMGCKADVPCKKCPDKLWCPTE